MMKTIKVNHQSPALNSIGKIHLPLKIKKTLFSTVKCDNEKFTI